MKIVHVDKDDYKIVIEENGHNFEAKIFSTRRPIEYWVDAIEKYIKRHNSILGRIPFYFVPNERVESINDFHPNYRDIVSREQKYDDSIIERIGYSLNNWSRSEVEVTEQSFVLTEDWARFKKLPAELVGKNFYVFELLKMVHEWQKNASTPSDESYEHYKYKRD